MSELSAETARRPNPLLVDGYLEDAPIDTPPKRRPNPLLDDGGVALGASIYEASLTNPDEVANKRRQANALGVTPGALPSDPDHWIARNELESNMANSPVLKRSMENPDFAGVAYDESRNLSQTENFIKTLKDGLDTLEDIRMAGVSGLRSASAGVYGILQAPMDVAADVTTPVTDMLGIGNVYSSGGKQLGDLRKEISSRAEAQMPKADNIYGSGFYSGIASLTRNLVSLPFLFAPGGQGAALGMMTAPVFGEEYGKAKDKGVSTGRSLTYGLSQAAIEYATEKIPVTRLIGDLKAGSSFYKTVLHQMTAEIPGEQAATLLQDLNEWAVINPEKPFSSYLEERPDAAIQTLIATIVGTGGQITIMKGIEATLKGLDSKTGNAQKAEQNAKNIEQLSKSAAESKLNTRDPVAYQEFLKTVDDSTEFYISGKELFQSGAVEQLSELSPSIAAQYQNAYATGGDVIIPIAEFTAKIAGSEYGQGLIQNIRVGDPNAMSLADAQEYAKSGSDDLKTEVGRVMGKRDSTDAFQQSKDVVRQEFLDQLNSVGRNTKNANEKAAMLYANRIATKAFAEKITPEEYAKMNRLIVTDGKAKDQSQDSTFAQGSTEQSQLDVRNAALKKDILEVGDIPEGAKITISKEINGKIATKLVSADKAVLSAAQRDEKLNLLKGCL